MCLAARLDEHESSIGRLQELWRDTLPKLDGLTSMVSHAERMVTESKDSMTERLTELGEKLTEAVDRNVEFMSNLEAKQMELRETLNEQATQISRL